MITRPLLVFVAAVAAMAAASTSHAATSETRTVAEFHAIDLRGSVKLELHQRAKQGVVVSADDSVLPMIETSVVDRDGVPTLEIGTRRGSSYSSRSPVTVLIDFTSLSALSISGHGDVTGSAIKGNAFAVRLSGMGNIKLDDLDVGDLAVQISGAGDLQLAGRAKSLGLNVSGKGNFDGHSLDADTVGVHLSGLGSSKVRAAKTLDISISGVGNVAYQGDAVVTSHISGIGKVTRQ